MSQIKNGKLIMYDISNEYKEYLRQFDNKVIAKLLLNNMIPVNFCDSKVVQISKSKYKDYYNVEILYMRKEIINKKDNIFKVINDENNRDYKFFKKLCCDFNLLKKKCKEWLKIKGK